MTQNKNTIVKNVLLTLLILSMSLSSIMLYRPQTARAQAPNLVPTAPNTMFNFHNIQAYLKDFVLDKAAVMIANQILQKMTASIVKWINTGFQGSPAFITNPKGFFLDAADQITGEYLDQVGGPLSRLCSPFSFDLRLNLALNQSTYTTKRYTCTLGKIVNNSRNAIATAGQNSGVTISGDPNGATLGNFMSGDFNQGGWEGFMAYSLEPQNNPIGADLMARSDLQSRISQKHAAINTDLNRGQGFMSWEKCTDVTAQFQDPGLGGESLGLSGAQSDALQQGSTKSMSAGGTSPGTALNRPTNVNVTQDQWGSPKYNKCETQTPGSLIGGSLQRQLNVPADKLVLVKTISDSIDAILGALVNQMLTQGLGALSKKGSGTSGGNKSYLVQLNEEAVNANNSAIQNNSASNSMGDIAQNNATIYSQTIDLLVASKNNYLTAKNCFVTKLSTRPLLEEYLKKYAQDQMSAIDLIIARDIDPLITTTTIKELTSQRQASSFKSAIAGATSFSMLDTAVNSVAVTTQAALNDAATAPQEYKTAQTKTTAWNTDAQRFQGLCAQFPDSVNIPKNN